MGTKELMPYTEQSELAVWELLARTPKTVKEDVATIKEWMKSQPHFPEVLGELLFKFTGKT